MFVIKLAILAAVDSSFAVVGRWVTDLAGPWVVEMWLLHPYFRTCIAVTIAAEFAIGRFLQKVFLTSTEEATAVSWSEGLLQMASTSWTSSGFFITAVTAVLRLRSTTATSWGSAWLDLLGPDAQIGQGLTIVVSDPSITTTAMATKSTVGWRAIDCAISRTTVEVAAAPVGQQIVGQCHSESTETRIVPGSHLDDLLLSCLGSCLGFHLHLIGLHRFFGNFAIEFRLDLKVTFCLTRPSCR